MHGVVTGAAAAILVDDDDSASSSDGGEEEVLGGSRQAAKGPMRRSSRGSKGRADEDDDYEDDFGQMPSGEARKVREAEREEWCMSRRRPLTHARLLSRCGAGGCWRWQHEQV